MKKANLFIACTALLGAVACNSGSDAGTTTTDSSSSTSNTNTSTMSTKSDSTGLTGMNSQSSTANKTPLTGQDSTFVMKAAAGGMTEVESANVALTNATNDRVKAYANMMIADHGKANQELMSLASGRGVTLPTSLPADKQKHVDMMKSMKGKNFDSHYASMMVGDHKTTVDLFEKEANSGSDADLKAWAAKTLPTLKMHLDSIQAISKMKM